MEVDTAVPGPYTPLDKAKDEIRLVKILPSKADGTNDVIACTMRIFSLDEAPQYIALSYTWVYFLPPSR